MLPVRQLVSSLSSIVQPTVNRGIMARVKRIFWHILRLTCQISSSLASFSAVFSQSPFMCPLFAPLLLLAAGW